MPALNANQRASYKSIGDRNQRVTLLSPTSVTDALGGVSETWASYGDAWAAVTVAPLVKDETNAAVLYVVELPHRTDVAKGHRVEVKDLTLKVLAVVNPELRNKALQLHCGEANDAA